MAFDFFDRKAKTFVSREYLERMLEGTGISQVPLIESTERISRVGLLAFMKKQVCKSLMSGKLRDIISGWATLILGAECVL